MVYHSVYTGNGGGGWASAGDVPRTEMCHPGPASLLAAAHDDHRAHLARPVRASRWTHAGHFARRARRACHAPARHTAETRHVRRPPARCAMNQPRARRRPHTRGPRRRRPRCHARARSRYLTNTPSARFQDPRCPRYPLAPCRATLAGQYTYPRHAVVF
jgi:hypothetical protein